MMASSLPAAVRCEERREVTSALFAVTRKTDCKVLNEDGVPCLFKMTEKNTISLIIHLMTHHPPVSAMVKYQLFVSTDSILCIC